MDESEKRTPRVSDKVVEMLEIQQKEEQNQTEGTCIKSTTFMMSVKGILISFCILGIIVCAGLFLLRYLDIDYQSESSQKTEFRVKPTVPLTNQKSRSIDGDASHKQESQNHSAIPPVKIRPLAYDDPSCIYSMAKEKVGQKEADRRHREMRSAMDSALMNLAVKWKGTIVSEALSKSQLDSLQAQDGDTLLVGCRYKTQPLHGKTDVCYTFTVEYFLYNAAQGRIVETGYQESKKPFAFGFPDLSLRNIFCHLLEKAEDIASQKGRGE